jgi:hypothetical protein
MGPHSNGRLLSLPSNINSVEVNDSDTVAYLHFEKFNSTGPTINKKYFFQFLYLPLSLPDFNGGIRTPELKLISRVFYR